MKTGFTIIELLAAVVVVGILALIALPRFIDFSADARERAIERAVTELNSRERMFWAKELLSSSGAPVDQTVFELVEPEEISDQFFWRSGPKISGTSSLDFGPLKVNLRRTPSASGSPGFWALVNSVLYDFGSENMDDFRTVGGGWESRDGGFFSPGTQPPHSGTVGNRLYIPNPFSDGDYSITSRATLGEGTLGGYGLLFNAEVGENGEFLSGFVLQFDRGISSGAGGLVIRSWDRNQESNRFTNLTDRSLIPDARVDPDWWTQERNIRLEVRDVGGGQRRLAVYLDGQLVSDGFEFSASSGQGYTGLRTWTTATEFHDLELDPL